MCISQHLDFDVARALDIALEKQARIVEGGLGLGARRDQRLRQIVRRRDDADALATTAARRLDHDRPADALGFLAEAIDIRLIRLEAGHERHARLRHQRARLGLDTHRSDGGRRRPDPDQPGVDDHLGERLRFGKEAVARMHAVAAG